jgi:DHA2 family multidrug resistance protein-like MFS transporter
MGEAWHPGDRDPRRIDVSRRNVADATPEPRKVSDRRGRSAALVVACVAQFAIALDYGAFAAAAPSLESLVDLTTFETTLALGIWSVGVASVMIVGGAMVDLWGARRVLIAGCVVALASYLGGWAVETSAHLVVSRALNGAGAGLVLVSSMALIAVTFADGDRTRAYGWVMAFAALGLVAGPLASGYVITQTWWWIAPLLGAPLYIATLLVARLVPSTRGASPGRLDLLGALLVVLATVVWFVSLSAVTRSGLGVASASTLAVGTLLLFGLVSWERHLSRRGGNPLIDMRLFANRTYTAAVLARSLSFVGFIATLLLTTQLALFVTDIDALEAQMILAPTALAGVVGALVSSSAERRFGTARTVAFGLGLAAIAYGVQVVTLEASLGLAMITLLVAAFVQQFTRPPITQAMVASAPTSEGAALGVGLTIFQLAAVLGLGIITGLFAGAYGDTLHEDLRLHDLDRKAHTIEAQALAVGLELELTLDDINPDEAELLHHATGKAFVSAQRVAFGFAAGSSLLGAIIAWRYLPSPKRRRDPPLFDSDPC